ncbi:17339_t:CDS:1, partial [Dentiscutata heterogama]
NQNMINMSFKNQKQTNEQVKHEDEAIDEYPNKISKSNTIINLNDKLEFYLNFKNSDITKQIDLDIFITTFPNEEK